MNTSLARAKPHRSRQLADALAGRADIVDLTVGEASFGPPSRMLDRLTELIAASRDDPAGPYHRYGHTRGAPALRAAISDWYARAYALAVDPDSEVLVTHGAAEALWLSIFASTDPGDEVLLPDPCYMLYEPITTSLGRIPIRVPTDPSDRFRLDPDAVARAAGPRTRLLVLNSPANPTGTVLEREHLAALVAVAAERGLLVVHDEVFDCFAYGVAHVPARAVDWGASSVVLANSLSKRFGASGWRLGWLVGPAELVSEAAKAHTFVTLGVGTLVQEAAAAALADPAHEVEVAAHAHEVRARGRRLLGDLASLGFTYASPPDGGFYLFVRFDELAASAATPEEPSLSEALARLLLATAKVAVVPGIAFGSRGEGFVRFSYAAPQAAVDLAVERLRSVIRASRGIGAPV